MNYDTYVCEKYLKNIADAFRGHFGNDDKYSVRTAPETFAKVKLKTNVVDNPAGKKWKYNDKAYILTQRFYDILNPDKLSARQRQDHGNFYAVSTDGAQRVPEKIRISRLPYQHYYKIKKGEDSVKFNSDGLKVELIYGNGSTAETTAYKLSKENGSTFSKDDVGEAEITVTYSVVGLDYSTSFYVEVCDTNDACLVDGKQFSLMADAIRKARNTNRHYRVAEMSVIPFLTKEEERTRTHETSEIVDDLYYCQIDSYPKKFYYEYTDEDDTVTVDYSGLVVNFYTLGDTLTKKDVTSSCVITPSAGDITLTKSDEGGREVTVEYTDKDGNVYSMYFNVYFVYLNSDIKPPIGIYIASHPYNVSYTIPDGADYATVNHEGLKVCAVWEPPVGKTDEQTKRLKQKYFDKYPDMVETTINASGRDKGRNVLVRDITNECIINPGTGSKLWNREGVGHYSVPCGISWVDDIHFNEYRASFSIFLEDLNDEKEVYDETYSWRDPDQTESEEHTIYYDPVVETKEWTDPEQNTHTETYDEWGNSTSSEWSSTTSTTSKDDIVAIRYNKSMSGSIINVGEEWKYNKYYEVVGVRTDGSERILEGENPYGHDEEYTLSIQDGDVFYSPGYVYQTATYIKNPSLQCSVKIKVGGAVEYAPISFSQHGTNSRNYWFYDKTGAGGKIDDESSAKITFEASGTSKIGMFAYDFLATDRDEDLLSEMAAADDEYHGGTPFIRNTRIVVFYSKSPITVKKSGTVEQHFTKLEYDKSSDSVIITGTDTDTHNVNDLWEDESINISNIKYKNVYYGAYELRDYHSWSAGRIMWSITNPGYWFLNIWDDLNSTKREPIRKQSNTFSIVWPIGISFSISASRYKHDGSGEINFDGVVKNSLVAETAYRAAQYL